MRCFSSTTIRIAFIISSSTYEYNDGIQHNTSSTLVSSVLTIINKNSGNNEKCYIIMIMIIEYQN